MTTYYVSPTGSDGASGLSDAAAWRTVSGGPNAHLLAVGDAVRFRYDFRWTDSELDAQAGVTYDSYGGPGTAEIVSQFGGAYLDGASAAVFRNLLFGTTLGKSVNTFASRAGGTSVSTGVLLEDCIIDGGGTLTSGAGGLNVAKTGDTGWTLRRVLIRNTGDSGAFLSGSGHLFEDVAIRSTGFNASIVQGKHGVYCKASGVTFRRSDIRGFTGQALSLRGPNSIVEGGRFAQGPIAIAFFADDATPGTTEIYDVVGWDLIDAGFYAGPPNLAPSHGESFSLGRVTFARAASSPGFVGFSTQDTGNAAIVVDIRNSLGVGPATWLGKHASPSGAGALTYRNVALQGTNSNPFLIGGASMSSAQMAALGGAVTLAAYQQAADLALDVDFRPRAASPLVDAGTTALGPGIPARPYSGTAPDVGALEAADRLWLPDGKLHQAGSTLSLVKAA